MCFSSHPSLHVSRTYSPSLASLLIPSAVQANVVSGSASFWLSLRTSGSGSFDDALGATWINAVYVHRQDPAKPNRSLLQGNPLVRPPPLRCAILGICLFVLLPHSTR